MLAANMGLAVSKLKVPGLEKHGFNLNAKDPVAKNKAQLIVPINKYTYVNNYQKPYFYQFKQWFNDGAWSDMVPGKVTIRFDRSFIIQNGVIHIAVGSRQSLHGSGGGYTVQMGRKINFIPSKHNNSHGYDSAFVKQVISIPFTAFGGHRISPMDDIVITNNQGAWTFFSAYFDPFLSFAK